MKHILISGVSKGIGLHLSQHYLNKGFAVIGCSRTKPDLEHPQFKWFQVDLAIEHQMLSMFAVLRKEKIQLYGLINNAAIASMNTLSTTPTATAHAILQTNVLATFVMMREASKLMMRLGNARIINFTSVAKALNIEWESIYSASKAAVESLTQTAAKEFAAAGITVNAVGPGPVETDLLKNIGDNRLDYVLKKQAIHKMSSMADIANVCDFFLSEKSGMITAQTIYLGGVIG